jgi:hypothetical protein
LRPLWAYKEEIANQISKYRDKLLNKAPKNYRDLEQKTELNDDDKRVFNAFNHCLIKNLTKRFEIDYVSKGLLSTEELNDLTKIYYDSLYDF